MKTHDPQSFSNQSTAGVSSRSIILTNKSDCLTFSVASYLVCTSPFAVITVFGLLDVLTVSNSPELFFLADQNTIAPESTTNSLSSSSFVDAAGSTHSSAGDKNEALSLVFELVSVFGKCPLPCFERIAVVFQSLLGTGPQNSLSRDFADEDF